MKINIAYTQNGTQKSYELGTEAATEKVLQSLYDKKVGQEFDAGPLDPMFKGYVLRITGGQDKCGFPMKQGVLTNSRVKLLLKVGTLGFQSHRGRNGERKRRTIRGCIVAGDIALLNCVIVKKGENELEGLTDIQHPRRLGPKRASKIRRLFDLKKDDDVRRFVIKRPKTKKNGKEKLKAPKIQRLVTPVHIQRRKKKLAEIKERHRAGKEEHAAYEKLLRKRKQVSLQRKRARIQRKKTLAVSRAKSALKSSSKK